MRFGMRQAYRSNRRSQSYKDVLDGVFTCSKISKLKFRPCLLYDQSLGTELMKLIYFDFQTFEIRERFCFHYIFTLIWCAFQFQLKVGTPSIHTKNIDNSVYYNFNKSVRLDKKRSKKAVKRGEM